MTWSLMSLMVLGPRQVQGVEPDNTAQYLASILITFISIPDNYRRKEFLLEAETNVELESHA